MYPSQSTETYWREPLRHRPEEEEQKPKELEATNPTNNNQQALQVEQPQVQPQTGNPEQGQIPSDLRKEYDELKKQVEQNRMRLICVLNYYRLYRDRSIKQPGLKTL
ncbi:MAG TPA: hypothetical protein VFG90_04365 [Nitrososphaeraceae archaeon]|nr:hypothetical protein [Nitrososphaeraceae archaeon]